MTTLKVGIASYEEMKARTMAVGGKGRVPAGEPKGLVHVDRVTSPLSVGWQSRVAAHHRREVARLARRTGADHRCALSNWSRTLRTMEGYGSVHLERGERGRIIPKIMHDRVELDLPLTQSRKAGRGFRVLDFVLGYRPPSPLRGLA